MAMVVSGDTPAASSASATSSSSRASIRAEPEPRPLARRLSVELSQPTSEAPLVIPRAALTLAVASSLVLGACTLAGVGGSGTASVRDQAPTFTVVDAPADLLAVQVGDALAARRGAAIR